MDYYIKINRQNIPVSEAVYKAWCHGERKERYFQEGDISNGVFSYDALDTEDYNGSDLFSSPSQRSTEQAAEYHLMAELLPPALQTLTPEEKNLILRLYAYEESLRQISADTRIPLTTLQYRHKKILKKLNLFFEHTFFSADE